MTIEPPAAEEGVWLRPLGGADPALLAALHAESFPDAPWSARAFGELLALPGTAGLLAAQAPADAGTPLGFLLWRVAADEAEVLTLCVRPTARRRGVARHLLRTAREPMRAAGARRLFLEVAEDNAPARALYRAMGFREIGRRPAYYQRWKAARIDALLLVAGLEAS